MQNAKNSRIKTLRFYRIIAYNYLENIVAVHSLQIGIYFNDASNNMLVNVKANNNHNSAIVLDRGSSNSVLQNVVAANNGNGLCESAETCLYTPNTGDCQGHGNLVSAGTFTPGTITGVTLLKYERNGW